MKLYIVSGLGAKCSIFKRLIFPTNVEPIYLEWPQPSRQETWSSYLAKFAHCIQPEEKFCLLGFSFGGMLVQELNRLMKAEKTFVLSSVMSTNEIPARIRLVQRLPYWLINLLGKVFIRHSWLYKIGHGQASAEIEDMLANDFITDNPDLINWSIKQLAAWQYLPSNNPNVIQIIGDNDLTFPLKNIHQAKYIIKGGNHFCVVTEAALISQIIQQELAELA